MMNHLLNTFSVLELDVEDDKAETSSDAVAKDGGSSTKAGKGKKSDNCSGKVNMEKNNKEDKQSSATSSGEFKLPLVWIDLEMTGLNVEVDRILEIACIITDGSLAKLVEGPNLVIHQSKESLDNMGDWCQNHHASSGLTKKVLQSTVSEQEAEKEVIEFVKKHVDVGAHTPLLAGNSVYVDFLFLKKYMPDLASLFHHVVVDVSSVKALCIRWFPKESRKAPSKENKHRAMDDIKESIRELKYFKDSIFKPSKYKK
ncbi:oligoribonuclease-like isoform X1 [Telopea speciosissima]|uniref:oligoribonuclease-like isoform X1 n=1 Tax=Telopea speciosissima TaxID=54955 RepID=UPI001CC5C134|nr:oligoribonuclease-like isoform X1 [Telopea speciosissima]